MPKTWAELKAEGVKRCCVIFVGGKQCRRRANAQGSWCDKHAQYMEREIAKANKALKKG